MVLILVFQKILTSSDVDDRLCFPTEHLHLLSFQGNELTCEFDVCPCGAARPPWRLQVTRRGLNNPKPVITRGSWAQIVEHGGLRVGDRLTFFIDDEEYPRYKIMVERRGIKLLGAMIYHPNSSNWLLVI